MTLLTRRCGNRWSLTWQHIVKNEHSKLLLLLFLQSYIFTLVTFKCSPYAKIVKHQFQLTCICFCTVSAHAHFTQICNPFMFEYNHPRVWGYVVLSMHIDVIFFLFRTFKGGGLIWLNGWVFVYRQLLACWLWGAATTTGSFVSSVTFKTCLLSTERRGRRRGRDKWR